MRGIIVSAATALAVSVVSVAVAAPASADQLKIKDPKGDVYKVAQDGTQGDVPQGEVPNTDISRTVVRHGAGAVGFTVRYVNLKKNASAFISYDAEIRVPHQGTFHALVTIDPSIKSAGINLTDAHYESIDCAHAVAVVHEDEGRLIARVPRSCLGDPEWIRFGASALSLTRAGAKKALVDNVLSQGDQLTEKLYAG
jgi:hypothetical protein